ncbi:hypothetical protein Acsp06_25960 [Actinomycetospora sp. NBRC 106375]|nr:hypothetical protein Acsp06_25960 [Actinomycetospora sp. NBRC 106375]
MRRRPRGARPVRRRRTLGRHPGWELNYRHYAAPPRTAVRYRLEVGLPEPGPGRWPVTRTPTRHGWAQLVPAPDPVAAD